MEFQEQLKNLNFIRLNYKKLRHFDLILCLLSQKKFAKSLDSTLFHEKFSEMELDLTK